MRETILTIEDDASTRKAISLYLDSLGYEVLEAENGRVGLNLFLEREADLILLDLRMPEMDGLAVLEQVQADSPETPVIVISGVDKVEDVIQALHLGAWDYIMKPIQQMSILRHSVEKTLDRARLIRENREYQARLESAIEERTRELLITNQNLMREIKERMKAEEKERVHHQQLIQADKMASLGILISEVAHEINNPNSIIMVNTPILKKIWKALKPILDEHYRSNGDFFLAPRIKYSEMKDDVTRLITGILDGARRISNFVGELKEFAAPARALPAEEIDINRVVRSATRLLTNLIKKSTDSFSLCCGENLPKVWGHFQHLEQVVVNLIENSCQALPNRQKGLSVITDIDSDRGMVFIEINDEGSGMTADTLKKIMDPFFTTKRKSGGTGLGLSISSKIISDHDGLLEFSSQPGRGTSAVIRLPVKDKQSGG